LTKKGEIEAQREGHFISPWPPTLVLGPRVDYGCGWFQPNRVQRCLARQQWRCCLPADRGLATRKHVTPRPSLCRWWLVAACFQSQKCSATSFRPH